MRVFMKPSFVTNNRISCRQRRSRVAGGAAAENVRGGGEGSHERGTRRGLREIYPRGGVSLYVLVVPK